MTKPARPTVADLRAASKAMRAGGDAVYCAASMGIMRRLREGCIPVCGHSGLIPTQATWTGGFNAVGKTLETAMLVWRQVKALEEAGVFAVYLPHDSNRRTPMKLFSRLACGCLLSLALAVGAFAQDAATNPGDALVLFASEEGLARLASSTARADFPTLANQFEAQSNAAFCGPTTAAIVLNAMRGRSKDLPRDRNRLRPEDLQFLGAGFDLALPRFTQDNVLEKSPKTRAQILGEPSQRNGKSVQDFGYQTRQLDAMLKANGVATRLVIVDDGKAEADIRAELVQNLNTPGDYVIVTYKRSAVGQQGGGHISPLGAYDPASDSFLVMDVNPTSAGWVWMPTPVLVRGMRTLDTIENRGYVLVGLQ